MEAPQKKNKKKNTYAFCNAEPQECICEIAWKLLVECQAALSLR